MKNLLFILLIMLCHSGILHAQCDVIPELATAYDHQARIIALDEMLDSGSADTNSIRIPESYVTTVLEHLSAIYHSPFTAEADSIFNIYCINNPNSEENRGYLSRTIYVELDTAASWTAPWLNEQIPSGHPFIDSLLEGIDYEIELYIPSILTGVVKITFEEIINLPTLIEILDTIQGVNFAEHVPSIGDGNQVIYYRDEEDYQISFKLGWDDCFSGCISERFWQFTIDTDCNVEFQGTYGPPVTSWFNEPPGAEHCNILSATSDTRNSSRIALFPNPASHLLHVQSETPLHAVSICNLFGSLANYYPAGQTAFSIDVSALQPGLHVVIVNQDAIGRFVRY